MSAVLFAPFMESNYNMWDSAEQSQRKKLPKCATVICSAVSLAVYCMSPMEVRGLSGQKTCPLVIPVVNQLLKVEVG